MVGKNNNKVITDNNSEKQQKFAIKKLKAGVASVAVMSMVLLASDFTLNKVQAQETEPSVAQEIIEEPTAFVAELQVMEDVTENHIALEITDVDEVSAVELVNEFSEIDVVDSPENMEVELTAVEPSIEEIEVSAAEETSLFELTVDQALEAPIVSDSAIADPIEEGYFRFNFAGLTQEQIDTYGLWIWGDVATPSDTVGGWPDGAMKFAESKQDAYGYFLDVAMSDAPKTINFLINKMNGDNVTADQSVNLLSPDMNQLWIDKDFGLHLYEQLADEGLLRVNYYRQDGDYTGWSLWTWDDVEEPTQNWPSGAHEFVNEGIFGRYIDLPLVEGAKNISFLILNTITGEQSGDINFTDRENHSQVFLRELEAEVYTNPYFAKVDRLETGELLSETQISLNFSSVDEVTRESLLADLEIIDSAGNVVAVSDVLIDEETGRIMVQGQFDYLEAPYKVRYGDQELALQIGWRIKDELYAYEDQLGLDLREDGTAELKLWSPSASAVNVILYDKNDQNKVVGTWELAREDRGVWRVELSEDETGIDNHTGYYYHFEIERDGEKVVVLDPYAKSLAAWDNLSAEHTVAKAAMVNPSLLGPELDFAQIDGYEKREDAIIYEVHVRDFTSDPSIADDLMSQFGTFSAFIDKLDYIQSLGVTHVQLLPVMSYYYANEFANGERLSEYASTNVNYNWGYDPQSYFALTGMYSENPENPAQRIEEFKELVDEIHSRGMGVILDVVYNHTARTHIFEDLEPNYYHFMDADGTPRESFGGGRLGTTHAMARRILVDSIAYWTEEFKIDGFRFDMMGDHDAEAIQIAYDRAAALNPNMLMIGEGWITFAGDETDWGVTAADQNWMSETDSVGVFSDEIRNELKSGFGSEGEARFLTGGSRNIHLIFNNIMGKPSNFNADDPGDVIQYIAAHDNLTLHDVIAQSIKKDPKYHEAEIHQRIRIGNLMILTSQGTPFIHSGQEYGRTKQYRDDDYLNAVAPGEEPYKSTFMTDAEGNPFEYPYFIHDSYDSSDAVNQFDWQMATDAEAFPIQGLTQAYTSGLIHLRRSTDAFRYGTAEEIANNVTLIEAPEIGQEDLVMGYQAIDSKGDIYIVFVNADETVRTISFMDHFKHIGKGEIIVDGLVAGTLAIDNPSGVALGEDSLTLDPLTATIIRLKKTDSVTVTEEIAFETVERDNSELEEGVRVIVQEGVVGTRTITYEILYEYGEEVSRREVSNEVTVAPVDKIVDVGSKVLDLETPEENDGNEEEPAESGSSLDEDEAELVVDKASLLPNTGETSKLPLIGAATLIALTGASLILAARKREE